jgi:tRNA modification GTPase
VAPPVRREQAQLTDTIFAVSSGRPPAAIAVIRVSGPRAFASVQALAGPLPSPRTASLRTLLRNGAVLDQALVLIFPGPRSATGEDLAELHCHGGRAVIAAAEAALSEQPELRRAEPGEFTRRALANGRIDLMEAEGLADLLEAETEAQRIAAVVAAEGQLSARTRAWLDRVVMLSAQVEAMLDYADEDDVAKDEGALAAVRDDMATLAADIQVALKAPSVERLRDGVRVVIAGPPNAGKSTLLNLLAAREAAIVSPIAGTTRDRIEAPVLRGGVAMLLVDTAGVTETDDPIEAIGVERARSAIDDADVLLWLGDDPPPRPDAIWVHARCDQLGREIAPEGRELAVSAHDGASVLRLWSLLQTRAAALVSVSDGVPAMREHQRQTCRDVVDALILESDPLIVAEALREARGSLSRLLGLDATEIMLDALFSRFCVGK